MGYFRNFPATVSSLYKAACILLFLIIASKYSTNRIVINFCAVFKFNCALHILYIIYSKKGIYKMRRNYNPFLLPKSIRRIRFYCRAIVLPITVFQGLHTLLFPTTWNMILFVLLLILTYLLHSDFI